jgi:hypothetical protein
MNKPRRPIKPLRARYVVAFCALLAFVVYYAAERGAQRGKNSARAVAKDTTSPSLAPSNVATSGRAPSLSAVHAPRDEGLREEGAAAEAAARLRHAEETLTHYVQATRYPPNSRPLREHPDRIHPFAPASRTLPLLHRGQASADVQIVLVQDRLGLVGKESAQLKVRCEDSLHAAVPCTVQDARLTVASHLQAERGAAFAPAAIEFTDDGSGADAQARDGWHSALLRPMLQGFAAYSGPLRVTFTVRAAHEAGELFFELLYSGSPPARLTGKVREAVEAGSLKLYLQVEVKQAGRYVITGRVDDNRQQPFAYAQWNDVLREGLQEVPLTVFGKLIRDESPAWPLKLRDVDGFLLFEDRDPDREELPPLAGVVHTTQVHGAGEFSADEWRSEERSRHIEEFTKDVAEARSQLGH